MRFKFSLRVPTLEFVVMLASLPAVGTGLSHSAHAETPSPSATKLDFARDVLPILSDKCFLCHGPDPSTRKAGLRLDSEKEALKDLDGYRAIEPGQPDKSETMKRLLTTDVDDLMPPPKSGKKVTAAQIATLRRWIAEGAKYQPHWAFVKPASPRPPALSPIDTPWVRNPIDAFVLTRMRAQGLAPEPEAARETLIRRASLDLTGLPPTLSEVDAFLSDPRRDAYEHLIDRLLSSVRYGEHQARTWLDTARYGDTHGLHHDNKRSIWPYRDWVVRAFASNLPFDKFATWQLAGDLLATPSRDQMIATGFLRAHVTTNEQGTIEDEAKAAVVRDRVETFGQVFLGLTVSCATCHDHKYDPLPTRDFYSLGAYFDNGQDEPMDSNIEAPVPFLRLTTTEQDRALASADEPIAEIDEAIRTALSAVTYHDPMNEAAVAKIMPTEHEWRKRTFTDAVAKTRDATFTLVSPTAKLDGREQGVNIQSPTAGKVSFVDEKALLEIGQGDVLSVEVFLDAKRPPSSVMVEYKIAGAEGNWNHRSYWGESAPAGVDAADPLNDELPNYVRAGALPKPGRWVTLRISPPELKLEVNAKITGVAFAQTGGRAHWDRVALRTLTPQEGTGIESLALWSTLQVRKIKDNIPVGFGGPTKKALQLAPAARSESAKRAIADYFFEWVWAGGRSVFEPLHKLREPLVKSRQDLLDGIPHTLVYRERKHRLAPSHILVRGEYDKKGDEVTARPPQVLPPLPKDAPAGRLGLARWLTDPEHPLTARVTVNRFWQQHFGTGLVKTSWDFGLQGEFPSHPELLYWG